MPTCPGRPLLILQASASPSTKVPALLLPSGTITSCDPPSLPSTSGARQQPPQGHPTPDSQQRAQHTLAEGAGLVFAEGNHKGGLSSLSLYRGDPRAGRRRDPAATELRAGNQTGPYPSLPQLPCRAYGAQTRDHGARPRPLQSKPSGLRLKAAPPSGELRAQCSPTRDPGPCMRLSHHLLQEATCPSLERCPSSCAPGHSAPVCTLTLALQPVTCVYTCLSPDRSCFAEFSISVLRTVPGARSAFIQPKKCSPREVSTPQGCSGAKDTSFS